MKFRTHGRTDWPVWSRGEHIATLQDAAQGGEGRTETPGLLWFLLPSHFPLEVHLDPSSDRSARISSAHPSPSLPLPRLPLQLWGMLPVIQ